LVDLAYLVYLVRLVYPVAEKNQRDQTDFFPIRAAAAIRGGTVVWRAK
jgi:hypothetical protein